MANLTIGDLTTAGALTDAELVELEQSGAGRKVSLATIFNRLLAVERSFEETLKLAERAAAKDDTAGYGQIWVKDTTPNELWFTDDAGTDHQLGAGGGGGGGFTALFQSSTYPNLSTTFIDFTDLEFTADANSKYIITAYLKHVGNGGRDFKFKWDVPSGATLNGLGGNSATPLAEADLTSATTLTGADADRVFTIQAVLETDVTSGNVTFQAANTLAHHASYPVKFYENSFVTYAKVT